MTQCPFHPVRPKSRKSRMGGFAKYLFGRRNIFSALNEKMFRGWVGESRVLGHRSFCVNQPDIVRRILIDEGADYPKSPVMWRALAPLLGPKSVFLTNGALWRRQRRIIDPGFAGGKVRAAFPAMRAAADHMLERMDAKADGTPFDIDPETTHVTADVIFRTLFSTPITADNARRVFEAFRRYQETAPFVSLSALIGLPDWAPKFNRRQERTGAEIRALLSPFIERRRAEIDAGTAPDDLATAIMTTTDPETGDQFDTLEMLDQVAIFFLAGHETSASALSWALYLIANAPEVQERMQAEIAVAAGEEPLEFRHTRILRTTRYVFREALRLYPPVPFFIRESAEPKQFRARKVPTGSSVILAPWFLQRHETLWDNPHDFDPDRWKTKNGHARFRDAYIPFSAGSRVCPGAAFALQEGALILATLARRYRFEPVEGRDPDPVMQVTLRAGDGVWLKATRR